MPYRREYKRTTLGSQGCVDRLERFLSFVCSASWKAGELSAVESAVTVIASELLSVCVVNLYKRLCLLIINTEIYKIPGYPLLKCEKVVADRFSEEVDGKTE
ncbi:hypothetical protein AVEN_235487-1 [Araneus ventricosus]|uniref:Uncharacterized protein n=1 Tax=Araneus ventricosus TaxID=182803 RepID=A0A4Y2A5E5_ARAVE|nr:hypothetical protein AVEN_235487-1 [Araneus ventricosus]